MKNNPMAAVAACVLALNGAFMVQAQTESKPAQPAAVRREPVFPAENQDIVFLEGEEAVSTNFDKQPVLNYGCSGSRTLQLNRVTGLQGVSAFYAEYAFEAALEGTYELWYGGTPPGPRDEALPSYASPFQLLVDGGTPRAVYREDVAVTESYAPSYYWNRTGDLPLSAGRHSLRIEVSEKRRADGHWFFYLDCILLVRKDGPKRLLAEPFPAAYPRTPDNPAANRPFPSLDDAIIGARDNPSQVQPLIDLSLLYTMLGDYLNALKYLNKAVALQPGHAEAAMLAAKNRIWKGDVVEGLRKYRELLSRDPARREIWLEAGKVAAWTGRYAESISFLADGLAAFPKDLGLTVSLGLTQLWAGSSAAAEKAFRDAQDIAGQDPQRLKELAGAFTLNGYPQRAVSTLEQSIRAAPQDLQSYLMLMDVHLGMDKTREADRVAGLIEASFVPSDRLTDYLTHYRERQGLKDRVIGEYEAKLKESPDNLGLRQVLAETYFWNGQRRKAIQSYLDILDNHAYRKVKEEETAQADLLRLLDRGYLASDWFSRLPALSQKRQADLRGRTASLQSAARARDEQTRAVERARAALETAAANRDKERADQADKPVDPGAKDAEQQLSNRERKLAEMDGRAEQATASLGAEEAKQKGAEEALTAEGARLEQAIADALALVRQFDGLVGSLDGDRERAAAHQGKDKEAEEIFSRQTAPIRWQWDRAGTVQELQRSAGRGSALAKRVLGRIDLSDRQPRSAETVFRSLPTDADPLGEYRAGLAQSLLWQGKAADAEAVLGSLAAESAAAPSYLKELVSLAASLKESTGEAEPFAEEGAAQKAQSALAELQRMERAAPGERSKTQRMLDTLHPVLRRALVRAFYRYEESTVALRNDLGDYYLAEEDLEPAILQFRKVLAIDPNDLSAIFRLGKVYQWNRDWRSAMDSFRIVYKADPEYENVSSLYNQVARGHTDTLSTSMFALVDANKIQWHAGTSYRRLLNSLFGIVTGYQTDAVQGSRPATGQEGQSYTEQTSYQVHDASAGFLLDLYFLRMTLTPSAGLYVWSDPTSYSGLVATRRLTGTDPAFGVLAWEPYARVDASLGLGDYNYLSGTFRWGRLAETMDPARLSWRSPVTDTSGEFNLSSSLAFVDAPVIHDTSLRTYGKLDALSDGNMMWTAVEEVTSYVFQGGNPWSTIALTGNVTWQDSLREEPYLYYAPRGVLVAGGSLSASTWIGLAEGSVLGLSLRGYAGAYGVKVLDPAAAKFVLKMEGQADASLTMGNLTFNLSAMANITNDPAAANPWGYWSLYATLGCTVKLPDLIAP